LECPALAPLGSVAASEGDEEGFLLAIQLGGAAGAGVLGERGVEAFQDKALAGAFDGGGTDVEGVGNRLIGVSFRSQEQGLGATDTAGWSLAAAGKLEQVSAFLLGKIDTIQFGHRSLLLGASLSQEETFVIIAVASY
jgi:hypothetical protein